MTHPRADPRLGDLLRKESNMLEIIETLLVLQDRDRTIVQGRAEIDGLEIERVSVNERSASAEAAQSSAEQAGKELEVKKNALEVDAAGEQTKIITYSKQQLETKDNTQYRAFVKQIEDCKKIFPISKPTS